MKDYEVEMMIKERLADFESKGIPVKCAMTSVIITEDSLETGCLVNPTFEEIKRFIGATTAEVIGMHDEMIMVIDEDARDRGSFVNHFATALLKKESYAGDVFGIIRGNVMVMKRECLDVMFSTDDERAKWCVSEMIEKALSLDGDELIEYAGKIAALVAMED